MATNCCYNLPFVTSIRTPGSGAAGVEGLALMQFNTSQLDYTPVGNSVYYLQCIATSIGTVGANRNRYIALPGRSMTVKAITVIGTVDGTLSSGEQTQLELVNENDTVLWSSFTLGFGEAYAYDEFTGLSVVLDPTKGIRLNWTTPVWVTNPTLMDLDVNLYCELT